VKLGTIAFEVPMPKSCSTLVTLRPQAPRARPINVLSEAEMAGNRRDPGSGSLTDPKSAEVMLDLIGIRLNATTVPSSTKLAGIAVMAGKLRRLRMPGSSRVALFRLQLPLEVVREYSIFDLS